MYKVVVVLCFLLLFGCNVPSCSLEGERLGIVESKTNLGDPAAEIYKDSWLPVETRKEMLEDLFKKVQDKELEVFDFLPGELTEMLDSDLE